MFCRYIGVRYLWIDALCIKQGDEKDWRIQSGRMGSIYMNAACVVFAHFAEGNHEGFLEDAFAGPRPVIIKSPLELGMPAPETQIKPVMEVTKNIDESPLGKRGLAVSRAHACEASDPLR